MTTRPGGSVGSRSLRVLPRSRGSWIVATEQDDVLSEHATANEAETAALARLHAGDELLVFDRYHRCHRLLDHTRPGHRSARGSPATTEPRRDTAPRSSQLVGPDREHPLPRTTGGGNLYHTQSV